MGILKKTLIGGGVLTVLAVACSGPTKPKFVIADCGLYSQEAREVIKAYQKDMSGLELFEYVQAAPEGSKLRWMREKLKRETDFLYRPSSLEYQLKQVSEFTNKVFGECEIELRKREIKLEREAAEAKARQN